MNQHSSTSPVTPASLAEISDALQVLFNALPFHRASKVDHVAAAYAESLRGLPADAIHAGIRKFMRGECPDVSQRFVPTPPELAHIVRNTVVTARIPEPRRIAPSHQPTDAERARMRLKMPMFQAAHGNATRLEALAKANAEGFGAMVTLATVWGVPVPPELFEIPDEEAERQWQRVRNNALAEIERNPPPYLIAQRKKAEKAAERAA